MKQKKEAAREIRGISSRNEPQLFASHCYDFQEASLLSLYFCVSKQFRFPFFCFAPAFSVLKSLPFDFFPQKTRSGDWPCHVAQLHFNNCSRYCSCSLHLRALWSFLFLPFSLDATIFSPVCSRYRCTASPTLQKAAASAPSTQEASRGRK